MFKVVNTNSIKEYTFNSKILLQYWAHGKYLPAYDLYKYSNKDCKWYLVVWEDYL